MNETARTTSDVAAYAVRLILDAARSLGIDLTDINIGRVYRPQPEVTVYGRKISEGMARRLATAVGGTGMVMGEPYGSSQQQADLTATADGFLVRVIVSELPAADRLATFSIEDLSAAIERRRAAEQDGGPTP